MGRIGTHRCIRFAVAPGYPWVTAPNLLVGAVRVRGGARPGMTGVRTGPVGERGGHGWQTRCGQGRGGGVGPGLRPRVGVWWARPRPGPDTADRHRRGRFPARREDRQCAGGAPADRAGRGRRGVRGAGRGRPEPADGGVREPVPAGRRAGAQRPGVRSGAARPVPPAVSGLLRGPAQAAAADRPGAAAAGVRRPGPGRLLPGRRPGGAAQPLPAPGAPGGLRAGQGRADHGFPLRPGPVRRHPGGLAHGALPAGPVHLHLVRRPARLADRHGRHAHDHHGRAAPGPADRRRPVRHRPRLGVPRRPRQPHSLHADRRQREGGGAARRTLLRRHLVTARGERRYDVHRGGRRTAGVRRGAGVGGVRAGALNGRTVRVRQLSPCAASASLAWAASPSAPQERARSRPRRRSAAERARMPCSMRAAACSYWEGEASR
ncbi:hypothetical protein SGPA1_10335 [Streptomyces misionensis JCM 4497]